MQTQLRLIGVVRARELSKHKLRAHISSGFTEGSYFNACGAGSVGRHNATGAQRVDLLGYVRQKNGDARYPYQKGPLETKRRNAQALLLGRLHSSMKATSLSQQRNF